MDTGYPDSDARDDFARVRRKAQWARVRGRLRGRSGDVDPMLPFDEVVAALGRRGQRTVGLREVPLEAVVGSVDRTRGFDRAFRPTDALSRQRFERIAAGVRRGAEVSPVDLYQVGEVYFVRDGHHRIAVLRALGRATVPAKVMQIQTVLGADRHLRLEDLPLKSHERLFRERVPLPASARAAIALPDPDLYATMAEGVEAWGFRIMQARGEWWDRQRIADAWFRDEFIPTVALLREAGLMTGGTDAEVFLRLSAERYRLARSHDWDAETLLALGGQRYPDAADE